MRIVKFLKVLSLILIISVVTTVIFAQEPSGQQEPELQPDGSYTSPEYDSADQPEDSYLAKFHAIDVANKLMKDNLERIYLIKVIITNYPNGDWESKYKEIYGKYKEAMEFYYKRNVIYARKRFEENKKQIAELLDSILVKYKEDTDKILALCGTEIMNLHLDVQSRSDPNKYENLHTNQMRLQIAYGQYDDAREAKIDHYLMGAIFHYRIAKSYGIKILEDLAANPKEVRDSYKTDIADNLNRIYRKAGETGSTASTQASPQ